MRAVTTNTTNTTVIPTTTPSTLEQDTESIWFIKLMMHVQVS
jgi:hypothetical protein